MSAMMKSYLVSLVVLLVVCSKHVILSIKNDTVPNMDKLGLRSSTESNEQTGFRDTAATNLARGDVLLDANIVPTTYRSPRLNNATNSGQERDTKLMNLLAARRSALNRDRFRTHRRITTTGKTQPPTEATSKAPPDLRTICVRNCTKNFTRRTTASCMRQCTALQRQANATTSTTTTPSPTSEEDKSQRDNNEILFTDESSHGFFVVAKHINDTANHIPDPKKVAGMAVGNSFKARPRIKANATTPVSDADPYLFFGRKIPSLRPSFLSISTVSEERPRVLEVSVSQKPIRSKSAIKFNPRERSGALYTRKVNTSKATQLTAALTSPVQESSSVEKETTSNPTIEKSTEINISNHTKLELVDPRAQVEEQKLEKLEPIVAEDITPSLLVETDHYSTDLELSDFSTPLIISVADVQDTTQSSDIAVEYSTETTEPNEEDLSTEIPKVEVPSHFSDDKTNLIIFVNKTTEIVTQSSLNLTPQEVVNVTEQTTLVKTTILSSVRSTVYPLVTTVQNLDPLEPRLIPVYSVSESSAQGTTPHRNEEEAKNQKSNETLETSSRLPEEKEISSATRRLNLATYVLAGLGMFPIVIVIIYLAKSLILRGYLKHDEDFDVCITDQQPISPVKEPEKQDDDDDGVHYERCSISSMDEFNRGNLRLKSLLGEGNFGQVWKAEADDLSGHFGATRIVAVKTVRSGSSQCGLREEAAIMRKLGSHPNVVTLLGACIENEPHMLIMEFAMRGRLLSLLRAARSATNILPASVPGGRSLAPLSPRTLAGFALDIATGMEYIAGKRIVHRDLAARNVLIDHNGVCKICDFGMSIDLDVTRKKSQKQSPDFMQRNSNKFDKFKFELGERFINNLNHGFGSHTAKKHHETLARRPALPIRWMAPEALQYNEFTTETDVFAFGIVLWEIATLGATPYANLSGREVVRHVLQGTRPELPNDGRQGFFELMSQCWHKVPDLRPTFRESRLEISRYVCKWIDDDTAASDYMDVSGFSEDLEHGMLYFNQRISEFECEI